MRVMPSLRARRPVRIAICSELDLDIDTGGEVELHQSVDGLRRRIDDVEHPLVGANFELFARLLVDMRRTQHGIFLDLGRQWNRAAYARAGTLGGIHYLACRLIEHPMIISAQAYSDVLAIHQAVPSLCRIVGEVRSLDDFGDDAGADGAAAFADGKAQP